MRNLLFIRIYYSLSATMATHSEGNESRDMTKCETWGDTFLQKATQTSGNNLQENG
jgi:hypothetical protein